MDALRSTRPLVPLAFVAALAAACDGEITVPRATGSGGSAGGSGGSPGTTASTSSASSASSTSSGATTITATGAGGAPPETWWKHLTAPDGSSSWMTVPGAMTVDAHGHVIVTGRANGPVIFESAQAVTGLAPRALFVAKYDASGALMWAKQFGTSLPYSKITGVAAGADGSIVLTGHFQGGPVNFGGADLPNAGGTDVFVAKLDAAGEHVWSLRAGGGSFDFGGQVAIDAGGGVVAAGTMESHLGVLWISPTGQLVLEKETPGTIAINAAFVGPVSGVAVDAAGNAVVSGTFAANGADFGGGPTPSGYESGFVVSYAPNGGFRWVRTFGTKDGIPWTNQGVATNGIVTAGDALIVTGNFPKTIDFGGGYGAPLGGDSGFVAALAAADGVTRWADVLGVDTRVVGLTRDASGRPAISAFLGGSAQVGGTTVVGSGLHLLTVAPNDGSLVSARSVAGVVGDLTQMSQDMAPIGVDANGSMALVFGFLASFDLPFASVTQDPMSLEDMLLVHFP